MENYPVLFPQQPSSSYHFNHPPFSSNMVNTQLTQDYFNLHSDNPSGYLGIKEEVKASTSDGHGASSQMDTSVIGSQSEMKPEKNKGEKKVRKRKYAFQTRSQVDILDDGYRWRKYGQKAVKNNKFPRSYYRCTHQGCKVKKQVQRLSKDEGVVVTTYEGIHTHPIEKSNDNFEHILNQMQMYSNF